MMSSSIYGERFSTLQIQEEAVEFYQKVFSGGLAKGINEVILPVLSKEGACGISPAAAGYILVSHATFIRY